MNSHKRLQSPITTLAKGYAVEECLVRRQLYERKVLRYVLVFPTFEGSVKMLQLEDKTVICFDDEEKL